MKEKSYGIAPYIIMNGYYFILLNKSSRTSFYNFFKGKIEINETIEDCAIREFREETGVSIDKVDLGEYFEQINPRKNVGIFLVDFAKYNDKPFRFDMDEIYSATWINISKEVEVSKNQKGIFKNIMSYFEPKLKELRKIYC